MGSNELCSAKCADCGADSDYCDEGDRNDKDGVVLIVIVAMRVIEIMRVTKC